MTELTNCEVAPWGEWAVCNVISGSTMRSRMVRVEPSESGEECPALEEETTCQIDCELSDWQEWGACSASCGEGERTRNRMVLQQPKNGGAECKTEDKEACSQVSCNVLHLRSTLLQKCGIAEAETDTIVSVLVAAGVRKIDDICLLDGRDLMSSATRPVLPDGRPTSTEAWQSISVVAKKRFPKCICETLCASSGSPICLNTGAEEASNADLHKWLERTCGITEGVKELVAALQVDGVRNKDHVQFVSEKMIDQLTGTCLRWTCVVLPEPVLRELFLAGIPGARRNMLRACIQKTKDKEL